MLPTLSGVKENNPFELVLKIYNATEDIYMRCKIYPLLLDAQQKNARILSVSTNNNEPYFKVEIQRGNKTAEIEFETDAFKNNLVTFKN